MDTATDIYNTHSPVAKFDDGVEMYYKNFLASQLGVEMDDDLLADYLDQQADGWERDGERIDPLWPQYVALLRAAVEALLDGKLGRTIEETREEWLERIARGRRREESNLAILRAALG